jgi:segregation and condensation protein B
MPQRARHGWGTRCLRGSRGRVVCGVAVVGFWEWKELGAVSGMGVRGKIEAVIYAAEEPVTLAQLTALFGEEALVERGAAESRETFLEESDADAVVEGAAVEGVVAEQLALETGVDANLDSGSGADVETTGDGAADVAAEDAPDGEREKRAQRLLERQRREAVRSELTALMAEYDAGDRGMEVREIAGGYRVATKPEYHDAVRAFAKSLKPPMKLTLQALETLAVIAYKQPVTAPEVSEIRGVDSGGVMGSLISRKLVTTAGRKQVVGRPILYKTTKEFLLRFGLKDLAELPSMEEFEKMAGELQALGEEPEGSVEQGSLPVDAGDADMGGDAETHVSEARRGAPGSVSEPESDEAALEVPQEPELSVIVVEDALEVDGGMQVQEDGSAVSDGGDAETHVSEARHGAPGSVAEDEQDKEDESDHG